MPAPPPPRQPDNKKKGKDNLAGKGNKKEPKKTGINNNGNGFNSKDEVRGKPTSTPAQPVSNFCMHYESLLFFLDLEMYEKNFKCATLNVIDCMTTEES